MPTPDAGRLIMKWVVRTHGLWLLLSGLLVGVGGVIVLARLQDAVAALERQEIYVASWIVVLLEHRWWIVLAGVAIATCGLLTTRWRYPWLWLAIGVGLLATSMGALLACFVGALGAMYRV